MAESLAGYGAFIAAGFRRIAAVNLCINHLSSPASAAAVHGEARLLMPTAGKTLQVTVTCPYLHLHRFLTQFKLPTDAIIGTEARVH